MQRILLILTEFPPRIGGMQTHAAYLSRHLAEYGYAIEVFTHRASNPESDPEQAREAAAYDRLQPFPIHRILGRLSYQHNLQLLSQHIGRFVPDLIYASTVFYGILREQTGIPVVCRCVGNDVMRPWLGYPYRLGSGWLNNAWLEKILHAFIERDLYPDWVEILFRKKRAQLTEKSARAASRILANSAFTAQLLRELNVREAQIQTLVGGVESKRFHYPNACKINARRELGLPEAGFLLMTACRLVAKKGVDLLIDALPTLREAIPHAHLVVVGDGKYKANLQEACAMRGIDNVSFVGRVPHDMIHRYYTACDLFVLASRESVNRVAGTRDVETMGRVLCEANAAGIPVLASRSGGIASVIADGYNGLLFEAENIGQLVSKVIYLTHHPDVTHTIVRQGLRRARDEFDWDAILQAHQQVFDQLHAEFAK